MSGAPGLGMTDFHEKVTSLHGALWKVYFATTFRESSSLKSKHNFFFKIG
jgi:hypothetical protein